VMAAGFIFSNSYLKQPVRGIVQQTEVHSSRFEVSQINCSRVLTEWKWSQGLTPRLVLISITLD